MRAFSPSFQTRSVSIAWRADASSPFFHAWERRLASVTTDRVVRPFDWGLEWIRTIIPPLRVPGRDVTSGRRRFSENGCHM